jgi:hypothetical protein
MIRNIEGTVPGNLPKVSYTYWAWSAPADCSEGLPVMAAPGIVLVIHNSTVFQGI